jgi:hypothetical protein
MNAVDREILKFLLAAVAVLAVVFLFFAGSAGASSISPVGPQGSSGPGCQTGGLFGSVAPDGNALVGVQYPDPLTGDDCILTDGGLLPGDVLLFSLYTPNPIANDSVDIAVEEFTWGSQTIVVPGPNGTSIPETYPVQVNVQWSNATVAAKSGEFQQFDLQVPPVFVLPANAENLTIDILGLPLNYLIATPGTALPIAETLGGLIGWLGLMAPLAVVSFVGGFGPGQAIVNRLRHVSSGKWAALFCFLLSLAIVVGIGVDFTGFLYWLGNIGITGLAFLLLFPCFFWGCALWITVRGKHLKYRLARGPIAETKKGDPVADVIPVRIFGGGETGKPEELVDGLGVGGLRGAWNRMLGLRVKWNVNSVARDPRLIFYRWPEGKLDIEGEYAVWPKDGGRQLDYAVTNPAKIWFPWRKSVRAKFDPLPAEANGGTVPIENDGARDPAMWAHRGWFLGLRHGEARLAALGSPDHLGPDSYIRGVAPAAAFGRESQRRGTALVLMSDQVDALAEKKAFELEAIHDRMEAFPHSPEALEGSRILATRIIRNLFDPTEFMNRLEERGRLRVDYQPPGATKWSTSSEVRIEANEPRPPELRGKPEKRGA